MRVLAAAALGTWLLLEASVASASGFDAPNVGSQQSGPVTRDAAAIHHNPAQLGALAQPQLDLGGGVIFGAIAYERDRRGAYQFEDNLDFAEPIDPRNLDPGKTGAAGTVRARPVGPTIDAFVAIPAIRERLSFGLGVYVPYAAILDLPQDGPQRFQIQSVDLISANVTLAAGVKLHEVISIGAGVSYVLSFMQLRRVQDFAAVDIFAEGLAREPINQQNDFGSQAPSTVRELDVLARQVDVERAVSHGVTFNAGVALRPTRKLDLALVYQHGSRVRANGRFTLNMDDEFFTQDLAAQGVRFAPIVRGDAHIEFSLPKRLTLGAGYLVHRKFSIDGLVSYVFWQDFDDILIRLSSPDLAQEALGIGETVDQRIVRDWKGSVHAEVWGRIRPIERLLVSVLLGYQSSASPDATVDLQSPDGNRMLFGAGVGWRFNDTFSLYGDFEGQAIIPRRVVASDFDLGNGTYNLFIGQVAVHGQVRFGARRARKRAEEMRRREAEAESASEAETESESESESESVAESESESESVAESESESESESASESGVGTPPLPPPPPPPPVP
jgi:long-chain fatty acid transport protein